jgi:AcrR family transcriptional regulator
MPDRPDGRSDHKAQTRQTLIEVALWLFATKGYEATSTHEIAELAGVSPRTFYRYFETKDRVLFFGGDAFNQALIRNLPAQPPELDDLEALAATIVSLEHVVAPLKPRIRLYFKALQGSMVLRGLHATATAQHNAEVAGALAARRDLTAPDEQCHLTAALASTALERSYERWLTSKRDLAEVTAESFALLRVIAGGIRSATPAST